MNYNINSIKVPGYFIDNSYKRKIIANFISDLYQDIKKNITFLTFGESETKMPQSKLEKKL